MLKTFRSSLRDQTGATAIEYSIIACAVAAVIISAVTLAGSGVQAFFQALADAL